MSPVLYIKKNRRYVRLDKHPYDFQGFPCDGIWLVQSRPNGRSSECILKLGELPALFPFASMAIAKQDLANFIVRWYDEQKEKTSCFDNKGNLTQYSIPSPSDFAQDILKFLASYKT